MLALEECELKYRVMSWASEETSHEEPVSCILHGSHINQYLTDGGYKFLPRQAIICDNDLSAALGEPSPSDFAG